MYHLFIIIHVVSDQFLLIRKVTFLHPVNYIVDSLPSNICLVDVLNNDEITGSGMF